MSKTLKQEEIDKWFMNFKISHSTKIDDLWMMALANKLWCEKPLGEKTSDMLSNWILLHINQPHISEKEIKTTLQRIEAAQESYDNVLVALSKYKERIDDVFYMMSKNDNP